MHTKLGFIGAGKQAREHARAAQALGAEVILTAVTSKTSENIEGFQSKDGFLYNNNSTNGWELLLKEGDLDAIIVAVPWDVTPEIFQELLNCPLPMLIEKPVLLGRQKVPITEPHANKIIGFNRRFYDTVGLLKAHVAHQTLKSATITISEHIPAIVNRHSEKIIPHLWETHCAHILDLMTFIFGPLVVKTAHRYTEPDFTSVAATLETVDGCPIHLTVNNDDPSPVGIRTRFTNGETWVLSPIEQLTTFKGVEVIPADRDNPIRKYVGRTASTFWEKSPLKPGVYEQMDAFLHGQTSEAATIDDCFLLQKLINALRG
jgi:predicted dehydrogenase